MRTKKHESLVVLMAIFLGTLLLYIIGAFLFWDLAWVSEIAEWDSIERPYLLSSWSIATCIAGTAIMIAGIENA